MSYPEWTKKLRQPGTSVIFNQGKYYLYEYSTVWCPKKKRARKVTGAYLGRLDEKLGLIPKGTVKRGRQPKPKDPLPSCFEDMETLTDHRKDKGKLYSISELFLCALLATLCGADGWQDIEHYAKSNLPFLRSFLPFLHGAPSDDTFRRFFSILDPKAMKDIFQKWVRAVAVMIDAQVIAIDGKCARGSHDGDDVKMLHQVHAYNAGSKLVIGQEKVTEKSNEITAIPKLLDMIDIKNQIVTIDAMGCQFEIANLIKSKDGDYIFSLKGNQGNLNDDVRLYFEKSPESEQWEDYKDVDKGHGRIEERRIRVTTNVVWLHELHPHWKTIQSLIRIESITEKNGKKSSETRYYISSLQKKADKLLEAVRSHWAVEAFHWVLDMSFDEDYLRTRKGNAAEVMSVLRHLCYNMLQTYVQSLGPTTRMSIKGARKACGWNHDTLKNVISKGGS